MFTTGELEAKIAASAGLLAREVEKQYSTKFIKEHMQQLVYDMDEASAVLVALHRMPFSPITRVAKNRLKELRQQIGAREVLSDDIRAAIIEQALIIRRETTAAVREEVERRAA
jgi:hypothetical protein